MSSRDRSNAILLTVFASLIWGTSFPGVKWGLGYVGSDVLFLWLRFLVASLVTLSLVLYLGKFTFSIMKIPAIWVVGALNALGFILQYVGLTLTTASKTALLVDINVIGVAIISYFVFTERLGRVQLAGIVVGMTGIFFVTTGGTLSLDTRELLGDVMVYLSGWSWAFFIVLSKKLISKHTAVEISSGAIASCTVFLIPAVAYAALAGADISVEPLGWVAIVYLGIVCTSIATLLWAMGLEGISATASATIMLIEVVTALVLSMVLLDESLGFAAGVGAALVLASIYLVTVTGGPTERSSVKPI